MGTSTAAGTIVAISAGVPATQDVAGYAALTYTTVGGVEKLGTIGATYEKIEFQPLNGVKEKHKGPPDSGALGLSLAHDNADAGQTILRTSGGSNALFAWKVTYPTAEIRYFQARTFGYPENVDGAGSLLMANPTVEICSSIFKNP